MRDDTVLFTWAGILYRRETITQLPAGAEKSFGNRAGKLSLVLRKFYHFPTSFRPNEEVLPTNTLGQRNRYHDFASVSTEPWTCRRISCDEGAEPFELWNRCKMNMYKGIQRYRSWEPFSGMVLFSKWVR